MQFHSYLIVLNINNSGSQGQQQELWEVEVHVY